MPGTLTTYKIFIASAGGLDEFRSAFRDTVEHYNSTEAYNRGYMFMPIGWEDATTGCGRPQALINADLKQCDFALFMFRNRWGTPPSVDGPHSSGTEEEWEIATGMHGQGSMRDIQGCFFPFLPCNTPDEMAQRTKVEAFKQKLVSEKKFFFKSFGKDTEFDAWLRTQLSRWLQLIERDAQQRETAKAEFLARDRSSPPSTPEPGNEHYALLHDELMTLLDADQYVAALSLVKVLSKVSATPAEAGRALLVNGFIHGQLNQPEAEIATYDELLHLFADAPEPALRESVAQALFNKGVTQGHLNQPEAEIATYDELLHRFADAPEPALHERVAQALNNKGVTQRQLKQPEAAMATYDELLRRFADAPEPALREPVARALFNKGVAQGQLNQPEAEIATYDELLHRFADASEPALREQVAKALNGRGFIRLMWAKQLGLGSPVTREHLLAALADFNQAMERMDPPSGRVLGNRAYAHQLLGNTAQAEQDFAAALRTSQDGGQTLYDAAVEGLSQHPIPEDVATRELVDRAWAAYRRAQGTQPPSPPAAPPSPQ